MSIEVFLLTQICSLLIKGKCISSPLSLVLSSPQNPCSFEDLASASCWCCMLTEKISRERKKGGVGGEEEEDIPFTLFSLQESNFPLAPNSNCRTLGMYLIYLSVAKSMKWLQKCGWNEQWWITILSKRLRIPWSNYFFHKEEGKKRMEIIPSAEVVFSSL